MVGRTLGHYRVVEKLGEGGMGEVYRAEDTTLKRQVALKVLPSEVTSSQERLARFQREAESLAALNHPNIITVFTVEEDQGTHFLTMELVEGESLDQVIPSGGLPIETFFELAIPLADALSDAHEQGIVHRDLKPANIMVDPKGRPKILDFGLAKLRLPESSGDLSQLPTEAMTQEGRVLGTYPYMSPEQVEGKVVDHRSDLFSFGTVLYEMATGERPFQGDSPASLMSAILRDPAPDVDLQREDLPHHLTRILGRCLEKDPEDRYQRTKDLTKDLKELRLEAQSGSLVSPRPARTSPAKRPWARAAIGALAIAVVLIAAILLYRFKPWQGFGPRITSLAVLPLENLGGDPEQEYFAEGMTEGLIADLGRISALRVISRQSVMRYKDSDKSLPEIAEELGVGALIEGSVISVGDRIRVTAQLVQAEPERYLWSNSYDREARDVLSLLSEVSRAIASEVKVAVSPEEQTHLDRAVAVDPKAHRILLKALQAASVGSPESTRKALEYLRESVAIDPNLAEAWVELASQSAMLALLHLPANMEIERAAAIAEMKEALNRALELDDSLSLAHSVLGAVHAFLEWDWERAERAFQRAIELSPSSSGAHSSYGGFLAAMGRFEEAFSELAIAEKLDPYSADVLFEIGTAYYWAHDFRRSLQYLDRALEVSPGRIDILVFKGWVFGAAGREQEAVRTWQKMHGLLGNYFFAASLEGLSLDEANRAWLDFALSMDRPFFGAADIATVYGMLGETDEAIEWLNKGFATRDDPGKTAGWRFIFLKVDPNLEGLHNDPRFQDLLQRMNLTE